MAEETPTFLRLPREIRDKIYHLILQDPAAPVFEGKNKNTKYHNFLGLMYANKLIQGEVSATLKETKPLFILSCNFEHLREVVHKHAIPYISDHHAGQVKCHSIRLHVKFPLGKKNAKVLKSFVLLTSHLKDTCLLLRGLSLTIPHAPGYPAVTDGTEFPNMQILVRVESSGCIPTPVAKQIQLLKHMTWLNNIGKITISGCKDEEARAILPGHDERLPPKTGDMLQVLARMNKFRTSRHADGMDAIEVAAWESTIATRAFKVKDFLLAFDRYMAAMTFIEHSMKHNVYMLQVEGGIRKMLDNHFFRAELGLVQSCIGLGDWERAAFHIRPIIRGLPERGHLSKGIIERARSVEKRIKEELGRGYDKEPSKKEAEAAMASVNIKDDA